MSFVGSRAECRSFLISGYALLIAHQGSAGQSVNLKACENAILCIACAGSCRIFLVVSTRHTIEFYQMSLRSIGSTSSAP